MSWDPVWEEVFRTHDWGKYPPEELVRFVARNYYSAPDRKKVRLLEVGCGTGANVWYMAREGFDVHGVDGAPTAIDKAKRRMAEEKVPARLQVGDIITLAGLYGSAQFDGVVDVACLWCNRLKDIEAMVREIREVLKPGGRVFSMLLAEGSYGQGLGREIEPGTFVDIAEGPLKGRGLNHFFTLDEVKRVFAGFADVQIEYSTRSMNARQHLFTLWVVQARKPDGD